MKIKLLEPKKEVTQKFQEELQFPKFIADILAIRNFKTEHEVLDFLLAEDKKMDPFGLPDVERACARIAQAIEKEEEITICGDYDVDGTLATTILLRYLRAAGAKVSYFIPHRTLDGYGINASTMENLKKEKQTKVAISVDTGTTAFEAAEKAKELGMDLIVTDHHNLSDQGLPPVYALINAKRPGFHVDYQLLAGSGVAYYIVRALNIYLVQKGLLKQPLPENDYLVLAMMATIADVMPLKKDNRMIVKYGLKQLPFTKIEGLESLFSDLRMTNPTSQDIAFKFAPIINAAGRMGSANQALDLFIETNKLQAGLKSKELIALNEKRKKVSKTVNEAVLEAAEKIVAERNPAVIVVAGDYHVGVIGIAAAKVVDAFRRPAIVIGFDEKGYGKASCRSVEGINIKLAIDFTKENHLGGGGHDMAAGFSINKDQLPKFTEQVEEFLKNSARQEKEYVVESEVEFEELNTRGLKLLDLMEPFGQENKHPLFKVNNVPVSELKVLKGGHLMFIFEKDVDMVGFLFFHTPEQEEKAKASKNLTVLTEINPQGNGCKFIIKEIL